MLGGEISVSSRKGEGSIFTLALPSAAAEQTAQRQEEKAPRMKEKAFIADDREGLKPGDKIVLIIEDDPGFAATLMKIARKRGYKSIIAGDGKSGILLADSHPVSAVILDLKLPDIDGINVLDQLKHNLRTRHIPVHIISGRAGTDSVVPLRKGAIGYLIKPAKAEEIEGVFRKIESLAQGGVKKILVVEDDKKSQAAIRKIVKEKDVELEFAATGNAARKKLSGQRFDCVILDLRLPDMTGFSWLEMMEKEHGEIAMPPVIVYTAQDLTEEENRTLNRYTGSIVIKGASSSERLLDEVTLFLHSVEASLPGEQQAIIRMQHDPDRMLQGRNVLLVDDDLRNTFALSKILKKHGMNVTVADNGQMALEKLKEIKGIELVIMDIMMPVMDGYEAMRAMRSGGAYNDIPVIALTARAMPEEQDKCMEAGANDYLTKPVDVDRLLSLIRVWLFRQENAA
jgi:CheY-like chemotaxis protein